MNNAWLEKKNSVDKNLCISRNTFCLSRQLKYIFENIIIILTENKLFFKYSRLPIYILSLLFYKDLKKNHVYIK